MLLSPVEHLHLPPVDPRGLGQQGGVVVAHPPGRTPPPPQLNQKGLLAWDYCATKNVAAFVPLKRICFEFVLEKTVFVVCYFFLLRPLPGKY